MIGANLTTLFPGMALSAPTLFRLTRDAEVELDDDHDRSVREVIREQLRQRRFEPAVRLEFAAGANADVRALMQERFELEDHEVFDLAAELDYTGLFQIAGLDRPALRDAPWTPVSPTRVADAGDIFEVIREADLLEHSRIFYFAAGQENAIEGEFLIGSADWMVRNLSRRVEVVVPGEAPDARQTLWEILRIALDDRRQAWMMHADGSYTRMEPAGLGPHAAEADGGSHTTLMELSTRRAQPSRGPA